jgi:hypothetical protein
MTAHLNRSHNFDKEFFMKFRMLGLISILVLSLVGWTQETPASSSTPNSSSAAQAKACCQHKMADMKDGEGCCRHAAEGKDAVACCGKDKCEMKDGKSCCAGKDMKAAMKECEKNGCCADGKSCGEAKGEKTAMGCCGSKCERHPQTPAGS